VRLLHLLLLMLGDRQGAHGLPSPRRVAAVVAFGGNPIPATVRTLRSLSSFFPTSTLRHCDTDHVDRRFEAFTLADHSCLRPWSLGFGKQVIDGKFPINRR